MGKRPNMKMSASNRAKLFMPFDALSGLRAAIAAKEKVVVDKIELSEEMAAVLDDKMHQISKGCMICVTFYCNGEYVKKTGFVARLDAAARILQVVDVRIRFDDILDVEVVG